MATVRICYSRWDQDSRDIGENNQEDRGFVVDGWELSLAELGDDYRNETVERTLTLSELLTFAQDHNINEFSCSPTNSNCDGWFSGYVTEDDHDTTVEYSLHIKEKAVRKRLYKLLVIQ